MKSKFIFLSFSLFLSLASCKSPAGDEVHSESEHGHESEAHSEDIVLSADAARIAGIEVAVAKTASLQGELKVPGTVTNTAQGRAVVTPPVAGKVTKLYVRLGDRVAAGQPVATLQSADLAGSAAGIVEAQQILLNARSAVQEARAEIEIAKTRQKNAETVLLRQQAYARTGAFSEPALQAAKKDLADAEAELDRGKQDQTVHQVQLDRAEKLYQQELISRTELEQARLEVATDKIRQTNAERKIELAKAAFDREQRIASQGLANSKELQTAEAEVREAKLEVQRAKVRHQATQAGVTVAATGVEAARVAYRAQSGSNLASGGSITVVAPISGVVTDRVVTLGQAVERSTELCEIENLKSVWVTASVSEKQIGSVKRGATARVTVASYPGRVFSGVIQIVGVRLDPKTRAMPVQVVVDNSAGFLRTDMFASVSLGLGDTSSAVAVPDSAIVVDGDKRLVYVAKDSGTYQEVAVETGRSQNGLVEIISGLEAGTKVVVKGTFVLKSEKVKAELKGHED